MKLRIILIVLSIAHYSQPCFSAAYTDSLPPNKKNVSQIRFINGTTEDGYILNVSDSSIQFIKKKDIYYADASMRVRQIPAEEIAEINKKAHSGWTTGSSTLAGFIVGAVIGFGVGLSNDCVKPDGTKCDFIDRLFSTKSFTASFIIGGGLGLGGAILGLTKKTKIKQHFSINGQRENIRNNKNGLMFY